MKTSVTIPTFDHSGGLPVMVMSTFEFDSENRTVVHWTNGTLRAEVPEAGVEDYFSQWPAAQEALGSALRKSFAVEAETAV